MTATVPATRWDYQSVVAKRTIASETATAAALVVAWSSRVEGEMAYFTDEHTGGPATSFLWDFGQGGNTSNQQNPSHMYTVPVGTTITVTVRLTINGSDFLEMDIDLSGPASGPGGNLKAVTLTTDEAVNMTVDQAINMEIE